MYITYGVMDGATECAYREIFSDSPFVKRGGALEVGMWSTGGETIHGPFWAPCLDPTGEKNFLASSLLLICPE
jgi:hypothetical protein